MKHFQLPQYTFIAATLGVMALSGANAFSQKKANAPNAPKPSTAAASQAATKAMPSTPPRATPPDPLASEQECKAHLQFLASDKLKGRMTGEAGNNEAAEYIANTFKACGVKMLPAQTTYLQPIEFRRTTPPSVFVLTLGKDTLRVGTDALMTAGEALSANADVVYVGFGIVDSAAKRDDYASAGVDVRGKIVVAKIGATDSTKAREALSFSRRKREMAQSRGALAFIELMNLPAPPLWAQLNEFTKRPLLQIPDNRTKSTMPYFFVKDFDKRFTVQCEAIATTKKPLAAVINTAGMKIEAVYSQNVAGMIQGADTALAQEYVIVSAHYDHIGSVSGTGQKDSIFNGARDNAMGTSAILAAAKAFAAKPPRRSLLLLAFTGEEMGLLGSRYYAENPLLPLNKAVYNLNIDGAGFNDTTAVTIIGLERTTARGLIEAGAQKIGLRATADPAPEQNLFDRSDNVSFAAKGIPAPTFAPGLKAFDADIFKYYHQLGDEAGEDFNFGYFTRFVNAYLSVSRLIADAQERPRWFAGDKYESAFQTLYQTK
ncbi:MAG: M28 family peptidase [Candidatus Kapaibacterium sp.]|nr:MAG: M28 family peptidase [Candidatus Kapabacteria bacterium]